MANSINYDDLSDDPEIAFADLADKIGKELDAELDNADNNTDTTYAFIEYMNAIVGVATALDIEKFSNIAISRRDFVWEDYSDMSLAVKRYVIEIRIRKARTTKLYSVQLDTSTKTKIHHYIKRIRDILDSSEISDRKRNSLFDKLNAFATDVDRVRTRFENAMLVMMELTDVAKNGTESLKPLTELVQSITGLFGAAKNAESSQESLPAPPETKRIEPPKESSSKTDTQRDRDEIPF